MISLPTPTPRQEEQGVCVAAGIQSLLCLRPGSCKSNLLKDHRTPAAAPGEGRVSWGIPGTLLSVRTGGGPWEAYCCHAHSQNGKMDIYSWAAGASAQEGGQKSHNGSCNHTKFHSCFNVCLIPLPRSPQADG